MAFKYKVLRDEDIFNSKLQKGKNWSPSIINHIFKGGNPSAEVPHFNR